MKIGFAQVINKGSFEESVEQCMDFMLLGSKLELDIICFPEMQFTEFFPRVKDSVVPFQTAEEIPGHIVERFQSMAKQTGIAAVLSIMERHNYEFYNASPIIDNSGKLLGVTRLVHIPQIDGYYAQSYFTPSCGDFKVYDAQCCKIGVLISYDRHFPEASRALALNGADIILIPAYFEKRQEFSVYKAELQAIAYQNNLFVGICSRVGREGEAEYLGGSMLVGPGGEVIAEGTDKCELVVVEFDLDDIKENRQKCQHLQLRRPDEYLHIIKQTCCI